MRHSKQMIDSRTSLDTPEGVQLTFHLGGPALRMAAYVADFIIRLAVIVCLTLLLAVLGFTMGALGGTAIFGLVFIVVFLAEWFYGTVFEWLWSGRTPGKRMFGLRVIKIGGYPIGFYESVIRNFLRGADAPFVILYALGIVTMMCNKRFQRLGDFFAGTMVVVEERTKVPHKPRNLHMVPILERAECRRGYHVSERTLDVVTRLFERAGYLSGPRREAIATVLAEPIADRLGFDLQALPPEDRGSRFLIRVIKTFSPQDEDQGSGELTFLSDFGVSEDNLLAGARR